MGILPRRKSSNSAVAESDEEVTVDFVDEKESEEKGEKKYTIRKFRARNLLRLINLKDYIERIGKSHLKFKSGIYAQGHLPREFPSTVNMGFVDEFISTRYPTTVSIYLYRYDDEYALARLGADLTVIRGEKLYYEYLNLTNSEKYSRLLRLEAVLQDWRDRIIAKTTHMYDAVFTVIARGENYKKMQENSRRVSIAFRGLNFKLHKGHYRMWEIFRTALPLATAEIPYYQPMNLDTEGASAFFPFTSGAFSTLGKNAVLFGFNDVNDTPVFIDPFMYDSHNIMIFGQTGSGKSYFSKLLAVRSRIANPDIMIYAIDPLGEYGELFEAMGGISINLWNPNGEGDILNPLDPRLGRDIHERVNNFLRLISTIFEITREEKVFLDSVLHRLYKRYESRGEEPVLGDLLELMHERISGIAKTEGESSAYRYERLLNALRIFDDGSLAFLNHPSTVDITGYNYVNFNLKGVPDEYIPFFMFFVMNFIYSQLQRDEYRGREKLFFIDEAHRIWRYPDCAERVEWISRHIRHFRGSLIMLSQSAGDGFLNKHTRAMMENTFIHLLLHHERLLDDVADFYGLSEDEVGYVESAHGGKGYGYSTGLLHIGGMMNIPIRILASPEEDKFLQT